MPVGLISTFSTIVALNATATAVAAWLPRQNMGIVHAVIDTVFDFLAAVVYSIAVVAYCVTHFTFNRELMAINVRTFNPSAFERVAAVYANPVQVAIIRHSLDSLRISTTLDVFTRVGVNIALCFRCVVLAQYIAASRHQWQPRPNVYPRNRVMSLLFAVLAVTIIVFTAKSIHTTALACAPHPECAQAAHRWVSLAHNDNATNCPCIAIIDRTLSVRTFEEWARPRDVTAKVSQLALSGDLQTLQLVNRALPTFPESLRRCTKLRHISLVYADTHTLPLWTREFSQLEYLHIEGKMDNTSLTELPPEVFDNMASLTYLHLGQHRLRRLPSLDGLERLKSLALAFLVELEELPSFARLESLERLSLQSLPRVETLPDLSAAKKLLWLAGYDRGAFCCNGFLGGKCDLSDSKCREHPKWGTPAATCLPRERQASPETLAIVTRFYNSTCASSVIPRAQPAVPTEETMRLCNGTLFRQCALPGAAGPTLCYSKRWMAVSCESNAFAVAMRREQIARGRGPPCDVAYEAWLGCGSAPATP